MPNVMFKRGTQANLNALINAKGPYVDGAFYLTSDTDRLYVAQSADELVELNKSITIVENQSKLPAKSAVEEGQFYYLSNDNILCIYSGGEWVQINPDTDTNTSVKDFTIVRTSNTGGNLTYTYTLTEQDKDGTPLKNPISGTFVISSADIVALANVAVDIDATATEGKDGAILALGGAGADTKADAGKVTIQQGDNVAVTVDKNVVTIAANNMRNTLTNTGSTIALKDAEGGDAGSVIVEGTGALNTDTSTAGKIQITHKTSGATAGSYGPTAGAINAKTRKLNVPKVTVDTYGHITAISDSEMTLPVNSTYTMKEVAVGDKAGSLKVSIQDQDSTPSEAQSGQILYNTITVDGTKSTVYNQEDLGSFYSATQVDKLIRELDSMTYRGTVGTGNSTVSALPTAKVKIGDTYKVATGGTYAGTSASIGDLFIAIGKDGAKEGLDGYLATADVAWTYINSGLDTDTQYKFDATTNKITIIDTVNNGHQDIDLKAATGAPLTITGAARDGSTNASITIDHTESGVTAKAYGPATDAGPAAGGTFTVPSFTVNKYGHVTAANDRTITLPDVITYKLTQDATNKNKVVLKDNSNTASGSIEIKDKGTNITVTPTQTGAGNDTLFTINHDTFTAKETGDGNTTALGFENTFTAITGITTSNGHVTGYNTKTYKLPKESQTSVTNTAASNKHSIEYDGASVGSIAFTSAYTVANGGVQITSENDAAQNMITTINMVWGSF